MAGAPRRVLRRRVAPVSFGSSVGFSSASHYKVGMLAKALVAVVVLGCAARPAGSVQGGEVRCAEVGSEPAAAGVDETPPGESSAAEDTESTQPVGEQTLSVGDENKVAAGKRPDSVGGGTVAGGTVADDTTGDTACRETTTDTPYIAAAGDITRVRPVRIQIQRSLVDDIVDDPAILGARIVPNASHGVLMGYRFFGIRPHALAKHLGLSNGDYIQSINGEQLHGSEHSRAIFDKARQGDEVQVGVVRRGEPLTLTYMLVP